eukprot:TRINITY_DN478_c1_g1_i6.p2 TRINITY_DN478_c1_g1~~TRINITY_DN478_c1_g1_i6.p2  ORF type:complete len:344 (-),score=55.10 TRINITY_DN478_c1_g1_i6:227-1258(-)
MISAPLVNGQQDLSVYSLLQGLSGTNVGVNSSSVPSISSPVYPQSVQPATYQQLQTLYEEVKNVNRLQNERSVLNDFQLQSVIPNQNSRPFLFSDLSQFKKWEPKSDDDKKTLKYQNQKQRIEELLSELQKQTIERKSQLQRVDLEAQMKQKADLEAQIKQKADLEAQFKHIQLKQQYLQQYQQSRVMQQQQQQQLQQQQQPPSSKSTNLMEEELQKLLQPSQAATQTKEQETNEEVPDEEDGKEQDSEEVGFNQLGRVDSEESLDVEKYFETLKIQYTKEREDRKREQKRNKDVVSQFKPGSSQSIGSVEEVVHQGRKQEAFISNSGSKSNDFLDFWQKLKM